MENQTELVPIKDGKLTSEYEVSKKSGRLGGVLAIVGFGLALGEAVIGLPGAVTFFGVKAVTVIGSILGGLGMIHKTVVDRTYIKGRSDLKAKQAEAEGHAAIVVNARNRS